VCACVCVRAYGPVTGCFVQLAGKGCLSCVCSATGSLAPVALVSKGQHLLIAAACCVCQHKQCQVLGCGHGGVYVCLFRCIVVPGGV
jgi:hypothetical protein